MDCSLPDQTRISQVHLRTGRLSRALEFYSDVLGLNMAQGPGPTPTHNGTPTETGLITLTEDQTASPRPPRSTGLYHFALRYQTRGDLARVYRRVFSAGYPVAGASDHGVSEAVYLSDPDGNGVELYVDRPRAQWRWRNGQIAMVTTPLDLNNLLDTVTASPATPQLPAQPELGHIHLNVAELAAAERFYAEFLGLAVTQRTYPGALFFASGGYHHHIGVNVWAGKTVPPTNSVGLVAYRVEVPVAEILYCLRHRAPLLGYETRMEFQEQGSPILQIRDVNGNWLELQASPNAAHTAPRLPWGGCTEKAARRARLQTRKTTKQLQTEYKIEYESDH